MSEFDDRWGGITNPPAPAPGQRDLLRLRNEGGFSMDSLSSYKQRTSDRLKGEGKLQEEIDAHWGEGAIDTKAFEDLVRANFAKVPPDQLQKIRKNPLELIAAGWGHGNIGMVISGKPVDDPDAATDGTYEKFFKGAGSMAGDLPAMIVGGAAGAFGGGAAGGAVAGPGGALVGGVVGAGAGGNALPAAIREALLGYYDRGEITTFSEFMERVGKSTWEVGKAAIVGAATAPFGTVAGRVTGKVVGQGTTRTVDKLALTGTAGVTNVATQALSATALTGALDGHVPDASDFWSGAALALVTHGTTRYYARTMREETSKPYVPPEVTLKPELKAGDISITKQDGFRETWHVENEHGWVSASVDPGAHIAEIHASSLKAGTPTGEGHGGELYRQIIDKALEDGYVVQSSRAVSEDARRMYEGLRRRGYEVELVNPEGTRGPPGEPVYRVTAKPDTGPANEYTVSDRADPNKDLADKVSLIEKDISDANRRANEALDAGDRTLANKIFDEADVLKEQQKAAAENLRVADQRAQTMEPEAIARTEYNLKELYRQTGITPWEANELIKTDPLLRQELFMQGPDGQPSFDNFRKLANEPPEYAPAPAPTEGPTPPGPEGLIVTKYRLEKAWKEWASNPRNIVKRIDETGSIYPEPTAIAGYLQEFAKLTGIKFVVGPVEDGPSVGPGSENRPGTQAGPQAQSGPAARVRGYNADGTLKTDKEFLSVVYMPDTPDAQYRAWYGLGRSEILFHEVGHSLDAYFNSRGGKFDTTRTKLSPDLHAELLEISHRFRPKLWALGPDHNIKPQELMADAMAVWLSNPTERKNMPLFAAMYEKRLEPFLEIVNKTLPKRTATGWETPTGEEVKHNWYPIEDVPPPKGGTGGDGAPPHNPIPPGMRGEPPERPKKIDGYSLSLTASEIAEQMRDKIGVAKGPESVFNLKKMYRDFFSELGPARDLDKIIAKKGYDIVNQMGLEDMMRQTYASGARAMHFTLYGTLDAITLDKTSPASFRSAQKLIGEGGNTADWIAYMLSRRTVDKAAQGVKTGFDVTKSATLVKEWDKLYSKATEEFNKVNRGVLEYARDSGFLSAEGIDRMTRDNPAYLSFRRLFGERDRPLTSGGKGFKVRRALYKMEGDDGKITDPLLATLDNTALIIKMADRNRAIGSIVELAERGGIEPLLGLKKIAAPEITATIAASGSDVFKPYDMPPGIGHNGGPDINGYEPFLAQRAVRNGGLKENQFVYFRKGKPEVWEATNPDLARLLRGADSEGEADALKTIFTTVAKIQRTGISSTLDYGLRTGVRDQIAAFALDPHNPPPFLTMIRGLIPVLTENAKFQEWVAKGGAGSSLVSMDIDYLARDMHGMMEKTGTWDKMYNTVRHPIEAAQILNEKFDAMARIGAMINMENQGIDSIKAATQSRKTFLDFVESGTADVIRTWAKWTPFMRPGLLNLKQIGEAVVNHPVNTAAKALIAVTAPTMLLYALNHMQDAASDEWEKEAEAKGWDMVKDRPWWALTEGRKYRNQSRWAKDSMFILPEVGGTRIRIPTPSGIGIPFGGMTNRILDWAVTNDRKAFDGWATALLTTFLPPFVPTLLTPAIETWADRDLYTGKQLIPASMEKNSGYMQYTENTTEAAKALSRVLSPHVGVGIKDVSPIVIDNWVQSYLGSVGQSIMRAISAPFRDNGRPWEVADLPFVSSFVLRNPGSGAQPIRDFFDEKKDFDRLLADRRLALKRAKQGADNVSELDTTLNGVAVQLGNYSKAITNLNSDIQGVVNHKEMETDEKRQHIDSLYALMIQTSRAGLEIVYSVKDATKSQATGPEAIPQGRP